MGPQGDFHSRNLPGVDRGATVASAVAQHGAAPQASAAQLPESEVSAIALGLAFGLVMTGLKLAYLLKH